MLDEWSDDLDHLLTLFDRAEPLKAESPRPEEWTIQVWTKDPGWVIVVAALRPAVDGPLDRAGGSG